MHDPPFVSVVTPFYNTEAYLAECIESVLAQSYTRYEYLLVNNRSTDGSRQIAERYAQQDDRIRLIDNDEFVGQVENYNGALARIHRNSRYVKMVQADDAMYPDGLRLMVEVAERDARIGLVGGLYMEGSEPVGGGFPRGVYRVPGKEMCRRMLLSAYSPLGSPTCVLYRADIVRARQPFFALGRFHEDTEVGYEILLDHDFGYVPQICTFVRTDDASIVGGVRDFNPHELEYLILLERYGRQVLSEREFRELRGSTWKSYLGFLGLCLLRRREPEFWEHHRKGLASIGHTLDSRTLLRHLPYGIARAFRQIAQDPARLLRAA